MIEMRIKQEYQQNLQAVKKYQTGTEKTAVLYGHIVQLKHLGTGKWLQGDSYTADKERDCLRLTLSDGDESCHFRVMPRFKIRREGSTAYFGDMLHLRSEKFPGYAVRVTDIPYDSHEPEPFVHETNLSLMPTALKVMKFYRPGSKDMTLINTNIDFVMFFHPESNKFLQGSCAGGRDDEDRFASMVVKRTIKRQRTAPTGPNSPGHSSMRKSVFNWDQSGRDLSSVEDKEDEWDPDVDDDQEVSGCEWPANTRLRRL